MQKKTYKTVSANYLNTFKGIVYRGLFAVIYRLNLIAIQFLSCNGKRVPECRRDKRYEPFIETVTQVESALLKKTEFLPLTVIEKIQISKIKRLLKSASGVPFWRDQIGKNRTMPQPIKKITDIEQLPILTKEDVRLLFEKDILVNQTIPVKRCVLINASSPTEKPLIFFSDTIEVSGERARFLRIIRWATQEKVHNIINASGSVSLSFINFKEVHNFILQSDTNVDIPLADLYIFIRNIAPLNKTPIIVVTSYSHAIRFAQLLEGSKLYSHIAKFITEGALISPEKQEYLEKTLSCEMLGVYSSDELKYIGQPCGKNPAGTFHINSEYYYVEVVDNHDNVLPYGQTGKIVITSLEKEVMPFIRYANGDTGCFIDAPCPCGRTLPLLFVEREMDKSSPTV